MDKQKIRILFITPDLGLGGAEIMLTRILGCLDKNLFDPYLINLREEQANIAKLREWGIREDCLYFKSLFPNPVTLLKATKDIREFNPDIIQGWMYHGNFFSTLIKKFVASRAALLWSIHHSVYNINAEKIMTRFLIRLSAMWSTFPDQIHFAGNVSQKLHQKIGYDMSRSIVIPNGFDLDQLKPSETARVKLREELGLSPATMVIGLVARYDPMKDHPNFFKAAGMLHKEFPDVHFVLVGADMEQSNNEVMRLVRQSGISEVTHLMGERKDVPVITAGLDIATNCSSSESFPLVVGEAMACGVPCVVTDTGDSPLLVGNSTCVVPIRNSEALAEAWGRLLKMSSEERSNMGLEGRNRIQSFFDLKDIVKRFEKVYVDLIQTER